MYLLNVTCVLFVMAKRLRENVIFCSLKLGSKPTFKNTKVPSGFFFSTFLWPCFFWYRNLYCVNFAVTLRTFYRDRRSYRRYKWLLFPSNTWEIGSRVQFSEVIHDDAAVPRIQIIIQQWNSSIKPILKLAVGMEYHDWTVTFFSRFTFEPKYSLWCKINGIWERAWNHSTKSSLRWDLFFHIETLSVCTLSLYASWWFCKQGENVHMSQRNITNPDKRICAYIHTSHKKHQHYPEKNKHPDSTMMFMIIFTKR